MRTSTNLLHFAQEKGTNTPTESMSDPRPPLPPWARVRRTWLAVAEASLAVPTPVARVDAQRGVAVGACVDLQALQAEAVGEVLLAAGARVVPGAVTPERKWRVLVSLNMTAGRPTR